MTKAIVSTLLLVIAAGCGEEPPGAAGGDSPAHPPSATAAADAPPPDVGARAAPVVSAVRHGAGWRVTVTVDLSPTSELWVARIRLLDDEDELLGETECAHGGDVLVVAAHFEVPLTLTTCVAEVVDSRGRRWRRPWRLS